MLLAAPSMHSNDHHRMPAWSPHQHHQPYLPSPQAQHQQQQQQHGSLPTLHRAHSGQAQSHYQLQQQHQQHMVNSDSNAPVVTHKITASATGKKRKRLQKACEACHRAKRRCDGGLPCSNCDFSGRTCCYSETANSKVLRANNSNNARVSPASPSSTVNTHLHSEALSPVPSSVDYTVDRARAYSNASAMSHSVMSPSVPSPVIDWPHPERRRELINVFFAQMHPFNSVIDEMSFLRDLSSSEVNGALLLSIFAIAAIFQSPKQAASPATLAVAEEHARSARRLLLAENAEGVSPIDIPSLDNAQTMCFLAAYEIFAGRHHRASLYIASSVRIARALVLPSAPSTPSSMEQTSRVRLLALTTMLDSVVCILAGQEPTMHDEETRSILGHPASTSTNLGHLTSAMNNFTHLVAARRNGSLADSHVREDCEKRLEAWTESLGPDAVFTTSALGSAGAILNDSADDSSRSSSPHAQMTAWSFAMMHAINSCSRLVLDGPSIHGQPDSPSHGDLLILLDSMRETGRRSLIALIPALFSSRYSTRTSDAAQRWSAESCAAWNISDERQSDIVARLCVLREDRQASLAPLHHHHFASSGRALPPPPPPSYPTVRSPSQELLFHPGSASTTSSSSRRSLPSPTTSMTLPSLRLAPRSPTNATSNERDANSSSTLPRLYTDAYTTATSSNDHRLRSLSDTRSTAPSSPPRPKLPSLRPGNASGGGGGGGSIDSFPQPLHTSYAALAHGGSGHAASPPTFHGRGFAVSPIPGGNRSPGR